jgi:hypothetical protein
LVATPPFGVVGSAAFEYCTTPTAPLFRLLVMVVMAVVLVTMSAVLVTMSAVFSATWVLVANSWAPFTASDEVALRAPAATLPMTVPSTPAKVTRPASRSSYMTAVSDRAPRSVLRLVMAVVLIPTWVLVANS